MAVRVRPLNREQEVNLLLANEDNPEDGTFAEHIVAKGDIAMHMPSQLSFSDAATLPSGVLTAALALYRHLELPLLPATVAGSPWLMVYGGSSASGSIAIQFAKLFVLHGNVEIPWHSGLTTSRSGLKVVTTCSPRNFDLVRRLGVDAVFDYVSSPTPSFMQKLKL